MTIRIRNTAIIFCTFEDSAAGFTGYPEVSLDVSLCVVFQHAECPEMCYLIIFSFSSNSIAVCTVCIYK